MDLKAEEVVAEEEGDLVFDLFHVTDAPKLVLSYIPCP